eukprot:TRINITY_DN22351_c0_g6_i1.p1 TRINITY_DN22351_c0_g6~~TRINITY_DN22351_c0_g6_i1.p1  ORF type:complete len:642 (+),score=87.52 TRINITY_DN22351_c0_g6_i1:97-2022(+)
MTADTSSSDACVNIHYLVGQQLEALERVVQYNKLIAKAIQKQTNHGLQPQEQVSRVPPDEQRVSKPSEQLCEPLLRDDERTTRGEGSETCGSENLDRNPKRRPSVRVFAGSSDIQKQVQRSLTSENIAEEDVYSESGFWASLVKSERFENSVLIVIILNTIWLAFDTDLNKADVLCNAPMVFQIMDNFFCVCFSFELSARFLAYKKKRNAFADRWFLFDLFLVLTMIWETWVEVLLYLLTQKQVAEGPQGSNVRSITVLRVFRVFRLLRVARLARVFQAVPELLILAKGVKAAMRGMVVTLSTLLLVIYILAIVFTQLLSHTEIAEGHFSTVPESINFMLMSVLCGFDADFMGSLLKYGWPYYALWLLYVLVGQLVLLNMLIGILCEVVSGTAEAEKEVAALLDLKREVERLDADGSDSVDKEESNEILQNPCVMKKLDDLGVDVSAFVEFAQFVFDECPEMSRSDFIEMLVQFRGTKTATVKDIVDLRKYVAMEVNHLEDVFSQATKAQQKFLEAGFLAKVSSNRPTSEAMHSALVSTPSKPQPPPTQPLSDFREDQRPTNASRGAQQVFRASQLPTYSGSQTPQSMPMPLPARAGTSLPPSYSPRGQQQHAPSFRASGSSLQSLQQPAFQYQQGQYQYK